MSSQNSSSSSFFQNLGNLFPIKKGEFAKFFCMALLMLCTVYGYSILRNAKDAVVVSHCGAEALGAIKLYGVTPAAILFVFLYTKLIDVMSRNAIYNLFIWFFSAFSLCFAFVLYPNAADMHPDFSHLIETMPRLRYFFIMVSNWSFSLFYIFAELYGSAMLSLLFWQTANQVTQLNEASRFYPMFGFFGQFGLLLAGFLGGYFAKLNIETSSMDGTLKMIAISMIANSVIMSFSLFKLTGIVGSDTINARVGKDGGKKKKVKMSFGDSIKYVFSSKYIGLIALLVICYGISINLVEGVWKKVAGVEFPDPNNYAIFMSKTQIGTAIATALSMLSGAYLLRRVKWRTAAIATPIVIGITGVIFFLAILSRDYFSASSGLIAATGGAMMIAVLVGAMQNIFAKSIKYSFFDGSKEMSYIVLDDDLKSKGKAAADVIGGRFGKSGGAIIQQALLIIFPHATLISLAPSLSTIFIVVVIVWIYAVNNLSKLFEEGKLAMEKKESAKGDAGDDNKGDDNCK